jgi:hypothetical protein
MSRSLVSSRLTFAAKARPFVPVAAEGTSQTDWLPEGTGFEPSVPLVSEPLTQSRRSRQISALVSVPHRRRLREMVQTRSGQRTTIGEDRIVEMSAEDANCLIPDSWILLSEGSSDEAR